MKYKIAVTETLRATRYIEIEYDEDIDELLHDVENSPYEEDVASTLKEFGATILKEDQPIVGKIGDWETESLDYSVMEEKHMKFYEIKEPYLALIAAKDEKQCLKLYKDIVCGIENEKEFFEEMKTIDKYEALKMVADSRVGEQEMTGIERAFEDLEDLEEDGEVLLIDGSLL
ncbi:hypothetical protein ACLRNG_002106 [Enterococcus faecalis]|jgi:hypothetical protein|uniref:Uncharacterized protein n=2 Tax=Enterococcus TaxID=1350 RepID=A0A125W474_ENTFL|nr:hypothetical protein [Enterococcus faecalis]EFM82199.1 hypothetical protein HMPREF9498_02210 [Enterococcus faecalis TX4248]ETT93645.1 hypothetical protein P001_00725 [Enterococcus faecalis EnGen0401]MDN3097218.1 hypothetical protein [Enterococcus faecalis]MDU7772478.1 hypothetical protein [Enterococcus faecalis]CAC9804083.1 hypothetical protein IE222AEMC_00900 [Enterococcus faecalis]